MSSEPARSTVAKNAGSDQIYKIHKLRGLVMCPGSQEDRINLGACLNNVKNGGVLFGPSSNCMNHQQYLEPEQPQERTDHRAQEVLVFGQGNAHPSRILVEPKDDGDNDPFIV